MGQYFRAVILTDDKKEIKEYAVSWDFKYTWKGTGLCCLAKLLEHSYIGNEFVSAVEKKLVNNPQRLVWAGDYADELEDGKNLFELCEGHKKIKQNKKADLEMLEGMRVINHDKKQYYVNPTSRSDESVFDPLPILTCEGNGRGGGDYDDSRNWNLDMVGTWHGDTIEFRTKAPKGYERIYPEFMCDWMKGYYEKE